LLKNGVTGLFPKGREAAAELTAARETWTFEADVIPSRTDSAAGILRISSLSGPLS
jgi:16S rRNA (guanine527-N7)-methyltransferase